MRGAVARRVRFRLRFWALESTKRKPVIRKSANPTTANLRMKTLLIYQPPGKLRDAHETDRDAPRCQNRSGFSPLLLGEIEAAQPRNRIGAPHFNSNVSLSYSFLKTNSIDPIADARGSRNDFIPAESETGLTQREPIESNHRLESGQRLLPQTPAHFRASRCSLFRSKSKAKARGRVRSARAPASNPDQRASESSRRHT